MDLNRKRMTRLELVSLLSTMDVPDMRLNLNNWENVAWLLRNLPINNSRHARIDHAMSSLRSLMRQMRRLKVNLSEDTCAMSDEIIADYLKANNYDEVGEWAIDAGYVYDDDLDYWYDDDRNTVDIELELLASIDSSVIDSDLVNPD